MKIFLTGAFGFVGQHLSKTLIDRGHLVYGAAHDELPHGADFDLIIHLAAKTTLSPVFNPALIESNIIYSYRLFKAAPHTKIIYASSTSAAEFTNPYAGTKMYLEYLGSQHPRAVGLRFFNIYGKGCKRGIIKHALDCLYSGKRLTVSGGDQIRDFIHISDVTTWIANNLNHPPGIVDIGTGKGRTIDHVLSVLVELTGETLRIDRTPPSPLDMVKSVAEPGIPGCLSLYDGLKLMLTPDESINPGSFL